MKKKIHNGVGGGKDLSTIIDDVVWFARHAAGTGKEQQLRAIHAKLFSGREMSYPLALAIVDDALFVFNHPFPEDRLGWVKYIENIRDAAGESSDKYQDAEEMAWYFAQELELDHASTMQSLGCHYLSLFSDAPPRWPLNEEVAVCKAIKFLRLIDGAFESLDAAATHARFSRAGRTGDWSPERVCAALAVDAGAWGAHRKTDESDDAAIDRVRKRFYKHRLVRQDVADIVPPPLPGPRDFDEVVRELEVETLHPSRGNVPRMARQAAALALQIAERIPGARDKAETAAQRLEELAAFAERESDPAQAQTGFSEHVDDDGAYGGGDDERIPF